MGICGSSAQVVIETPQDNNKKEDLASNETKSSRQKEKKKQKLSNENKEEGDPIRAITDDRIDRNVLVLNPNDDTVKIFHSLDQFTQQADDAKNFIPAKSATLDDVWNMMEQTHELLKIKEIHLFVIRYLKHVPTQQYRRVLMLSTDSADQMEAIAERVRAMKDARELSIPIVVEYGVNTARDL
jgi:hypothetical protein